MAKGGINQSAKNGAQSKAGTGGEPATGNIRIELNQKIDEAVASTKKDLDDFKIRIVEIIAIFVAMFTFISVEAQIFKSDISTLSAMGFTLIMLGSLLIFIIVLASLLHWLNNGYKLFNWPLIIICTILLGMSVMFIFQGISYIGRDYDGVENIVKHDFYTREQVDSNIYKSNNETRQELENFKACLKGGGWGRCFND